MTYTKPQLLIDTFHFPKRVCKKPKSDSGAKDTEVLRAKPAQATLPHRATHDSTARASKPHPNPATATPTSPDRREYERLRRQRPERMEVKKRAEQERRRRARELGLCRDCNNKAIPGQTRCDTCAEKHRQSRGRA